MKWIRAKDELPKKDGDYLIFTQYREILTSRFEVEEKDYWGEMPGEYLYNNYNDHFEKCRGQLGIVYYWSELPEWPKAETKEDHCNLCHRKLMNIDNKSGYCYDYQKEAGIDIKELKECPEGKW